MGFTVADLVKYISSGKDNVPQEAMTQLNQLLFKELREYCNACEDDRMICVLSPMCPKRILLKVRIQAGALKEDIPKFCYEQTVNNIRRFLTKKTTLYSPQDELVFNSDYLEIVFPRLSKKILNLYDTDLPQLHEIIQKSRVPAVNLNFQSDDRDIFKKIIDKDKVIKEGTFIYDILDEFLIVWYGGIISISDFESNVTIVNARDDYIHNLKLIDLVFHIYCAENDITGSSNIKGEHQISLVMKLSVNQIHSEWFNPDQTYFAKIIDTLSQYFSEIQISSDSEENLVFSMKYSNLNYFLTRMKLTPINYQTLHTLTNIIGDLHKVPHPGEK